MIGVLIVTGIIGYGILYSGLATVQGKPVGIGQALFPKLKVTAGSLPKPGPKVGVGTSAPRTGRTQ